MKHSDLETIIAACYKAATEASDWPAVLELIGRHFNASGAGIVFYNKDRNPHTLHSFSLQDANEPYRDYWWQYDTRIALSKNLNFKNGDTVTDFHMMKQEDKRSDPFFQEFGRAYGIDELMAYFSEDPLGGTMTVSVPRSAKSGIFDTPDLSAFSVIGRHVARAFAITSKLKGFERRIYDLEKCLTQASIGVIIINKDRRVDYFNEFAEELMKETLYIDASNMVTTFNPVDKLKIEAIIKAEMIRVDSNTSRSAIIRSVSGDFRLVVDAIPVDMDAHAIAVTGLKHSHTLLLLRDFSAGEQLTIVPQLEQLGLTSAEARVAMLIGRGLSPLEAAQRLSVSYHTIRAQLKSIYDKLYIQRQSELAVIVTRLDVISRRN